MNTTPRRCVPTLGLAALATATLASAAGIAVEILGNGALAATAGSGLE